MKIVQICKKKLVFQMYLIFVKISVSIVDAVRNSIERVE